MPNRYVTYNDVIDIFHIIDDKKPKASLSVTAPPGCNVTCSDGSTTLTTTEDNGTYKFTIPHFGDWVVTCSKDTASNSRTITISAVQEYTMTISYALQYGYRIKEAESDPYARVEYILDAEGMTPVQMDLTTGEFDYGSWKDVWFVKNNKPCMLKYDGTVDYYLDSNDYSKKEDGTESDVANAEYEGNAMSEIPLVWVKRYEDETYKYEIISNVKVDDDFKAYAHTRADGSIADCFYWGIYTSSLDSVGRRRSISGQSPTDYQGTNTKDANFSKMTSDNEAAIKLNGALFHAHAWSEHEIFRTLLTLLAKSSNLGKVFGVSGKYEENTVKPQEPGLLDTGGQFAYNKNISGKSYMKAFHIESLFGGMADALVGIHQYDNDVHILMAPVEETYGSYALTEAYPAPPWTNVDFTFPNNNGNSYYVDSCYLSEYGLIPKDYEGSSTTYYCMAVRDTTVQLPLASFSDFSLADYLALGKDNPAPYRRTINVNLSCIQPSL